MSVLIKGMEMPKDNTVLLRIYPEDDGVFYVEQLDIDDDILDKYWAVPVPPHGRLIDADALSEKMVICSKHIPNDSFEWDLCGEVITQLALAPTIIEAEGE